MNQSEVDLELVRSQDNDFSLYFPRFSKVKFPSNVNIFVTKGALKDT